MSTVIIKKPKGESTNKEFSQKETKIFGVYLKSVLERKVCLDITEIGKNVKNNLEMKLDKSMSGKCVNEGYIKPKTIKIINYSSGNVNSSNIEFTVTFDAMVCLPVEGMVIESTCKTITKAGIHAQVIDDNNNIPITIFIARDHHHLDSRFSNVNVGDKLKSRVIGIRYELDDDFICAICRFI
jgi:DNA-directed RNA polymerase subunit E'/Rpb7